MVAAETGQFVNISREDTDRGVFTVQTTDVPTASRRRPKRSRKSPSKFQKIIATLEPIHEDYDESETERMSESLSPSTVDLSGLSAERSSYRYDTQSRPVSTELLLDIDSFEDEIENVPDIDVDTDIVNMLSGLPPRPKCKRKVLPPSVTNNNNDNNDSNTNANKRKRNKVLKLRKDLEKKLETTDRTVLRNIQTTPYRQKLEPLSEIPRPTSAENKVIVVRLSELSSANSTSVPDLPSIMTRLAGERLDSSHLRTLTRLSMRENDDELCKTPHRSLYEDNGALSTPRRSPDSNETDGRTSPLKSEPCLKGSDMSSFYNMWDRDRNSRPFDKKDKSKFKLKTHRDCLCAIRDGAKRCFDQRHNVLPPIPSPSKLSS